MGISGESPIAAVNDLLQTSVFAYIRKLKAMGRRRAGVRGVRGVGEASEASEVRHQNVPRWTPLRARATMRRMARPHSSVD